MHLLPHAPIPLPAEIGGPLDRGNTGKGKSWICVMQGFNCLLSEQVCHVMGGLLFCNMIHKSLGDSSTDSGTDMILCRVVNWNCYLKKSS